MDARSTVNYWHRPVAALAAVVALALVAAGCASAGADAPGATRLPAAPVVWAKAAAVPTTGRVTSVSCADPSFCLAISTDGRAYPFDGSVWHTGVEVFPTGDAPLTAVSCGSPSFCGAVTADGQFASYDGSRWTGTDSTGTDLVAVSCRQPTVDTRFCEAVSANGGLYVAGPGADPWRLAPAGDPPEQFTSISCGDGTPPVCTEGDAAGDVWASSRGVPTPQGRVDTSAVDLSCPSAGQCVAVAADGRTSVWDGADRRWQAAVDLAAAGSGRFVGVACPEDAGPGAGGGRIDCVAVDDRGASYVFGAAPGTSTTDPGVWTVDTDAWSGPAFVDRGHRPAVASLSCTGASEEAGGAFCLAVTATGGAFTMAGQDVDYSP